MLIGAAVALPGHHDASAQRQARPGFDIPICEGEISTFDLGAVTSGPSHWVDIFDETDEALKFREVILAMLLGSGRATAEDEQLVFSFESQSSFLRLVPNTSRD